MHETLEDAAQTALKVDTPKEECRAAVLEIKDRRGHDFPSACRRPLPGDLYPRLRGRSWSIATRCRPKVPPKFELTKHNFMREPFLLPSADQAGAVY